MENEKKKEICDRYAAWVNKRSDEGIMYASPFRYMTFYMWLVYNEPDCKKNADELHLFFCRNYKDVNVPEFDGASFDPWID